MKCPALSTPERTLPAFLPWIIWGLGAILFGYTFFQRVAPGVMVDTLMREFTVGGAVLGNLSAVYFYTYALSQVPAGLVVDAYGSRRLLMASAAFLTLGSIIFASATSIPVAFVGRLLIGLGGGATFVIALNLASVWLPPSRFAMLSGMTLSFGVLGSLAGQVPLAWGVDAFGWRTSLYVSTLVAVAICIATVFILRVPRPVVKHTLVPNMAGNFKSVMGRRETWILTAGSVGTMSIMLTFGGLWAVPWLTQVYGFTRPEAAMVISVNALGWGIGSPLLAWISKWVGNRKGPFVVATFCSVLFYGLLVTVPDLPRPAIYTLLFFQGLGNGAIVLIFTMAHEQFAGGQEGASVGVINTGTMAGAAVLQPLVGLLLDINWHGAEADGARIYDAEAYQIGLSVLIASGALAPLAGLFMTKKNVRPGLGAGGGH